MSLLLDSPVRNMLLVSGLLLCYKSALFLAGALSLDNADTHLFLKKDNTLSNQGIVLVMITVS